VTANMNKKLFQRTRELYNSGMTLAEALKGAKKGQKPKPKEEANAAEVAIAERALQQLGIGRTDAKKYVAAAAQKLGPDCSLQALTQEAVNLWGKR